MEKILIGLVIFIILLIIAFNISCCILVGRISKEEERERIERLNDEIHKEI